MAPAGDSRLAYRRAGLAAIVAAAGYVAIPTLRALVANGAVPISDFPTPTEVGANTGLGVFGLLTFGAIAVAFAVVTIALTGLVPRGFGARCATAAGVAGSLGFALAATGSRAMYSFVTAKLTDTGADAGAQKAAVWAINVLSGQTLILAAFGVAFFTGWLVVAGRAMLPRTAAITAFALAAVIAVAMGLFTFFAAQFLYVPLFVTIGVAAWVRARRRA